MTGTTHIDAVFGIEPEGFITGSSLAYNLGKGFVPVRKQGKLPSTTISIVANTNTFEVHADAIKPGTNIILVGSCTPDMDAVERELTSRGVRVQRRCE